MPSDDELSEAPSSPRDPCPIPAPDQPTSSEATGTGLSATDEIRGAESNAKTNSRQSDAETIAGVAGLLLVLAIGLLLYWIGPKITSWINNKWASQPDRLEQLLEDSRSSKTIDLEADRAEYEGRLDDAARLREKADRRRSDEQIKAAQDKDFEEWRRKKYVRESADGKPVQFPDLRSAR